MEEWRNGHLKDIATIIMGQSPEGKYCSTDSNGTPLLNGPTEFGLKAPTPVQYTTIPKKISQKEDILFCVRGSTTGRMNWSDREYAIGRGLAAIRHKSGVTYQYYLRGLLDYVLPSLLLETTGSTFPNISKDQLDNAETQIPPLSEQQAIAAVLSSLDDKIDLLHRQNATLEGMAEALFKQWFVVEAKEEWEEKPLSSIANFLNGLACQKYRPLNAVDRLPVLKIRELNNGISADSDYARSDVPEEYLVTAGDVIFSWSASLCIKIWNGQNCILNQHLFKVTSENFPKWFYYFWCKHHLAEFIAISESHATTMGHIKRGDLDDAKVFVPSDDELLAMTKIISPLLEKFITNELRINTLEKLRDTLLPKLMSGQVRVEY